jgi:RNA polymerase-interacting CarD/CdnL/TRCF family regulator
MLDHNITPDIVKSTKQLEYMEIERKLTYVERATLMKSLRDLQSEISKIEGDYAPTKMENKIMQEQPLFPLT